MNFIKQKMGQIGILPILIGGIFTVAASAITSFATSNAGIEVVRGEVRVVEEREDNHYQEVKDILLRMEKKQDEMAKKINK